MVEESVVPMQHREWLTQYRRLIGHTQATAASACDLSHMTYLSVESGGLKSARPCSVKTVKLITDTLGLKIKHLYHRTDEVGRLIDKSSIKDIFTLFSTVGFSEVIHSEPMIRKIFNPELYDFVVDSMLNGVRDRVL